MQPSCVQQCPCGSMQASPGTDCCAYIHAAVDKSCSYSCAVKNIPSQLLQRTRSCGSSRRRGRGACLRTFQKPGRDHRSWGPRKSKLLLWPRWPQTAAWPRPATACLPLRRCVCKTSVTTRRREAFAAAEQRNGQSIHIGLDVVLAVDS